jgi:hypothetical protein
LIVDGAPDARSPLLFAQERAKPAADELVEIDEGAGLSELEVPETSRGAPG